MIQHRIITVLRERFRISEAALDSGNWDELLTGKTFHLSGTDLTYLFFELEKAFVIRIPNQYLVSYGFCSINKMVDAIEQSMGGSSQ